MDINYSINYATVPVEELNQKLVILDTCSAMHAGFPEFIKKLVAYNRESGNLVIPVVPICVYVELTRLQFHSVEQTAEIARNRFELLNALLSDGTVRFLSGYCSGFFADNDLQRIVIENRIDKEIVVLTQDVKLCQDLQALSCSKSHSVNGKEVEVCKLTKMGDVVDFVIYEENPNAAVTASPKLNNQEIAQEIVRLLGLNGKAQ